MAIKIMKLDLQEGDMPEKCREVEHGHPGAKVVSAAHIWIEGQEASLTAYGLRLPNESKTVEPLGRGERLLPIPRDR